MEIQEEEECFILNLPKVGHRFHLIGSGAEAVEPVDPRVKDVVSSLVR